MGVKPDEAKLLGLPWNKREDTLAVSFKGDFVGTTKREVLKSLASVFAPRSGKPHSFGSKEELWRSK